MYIRALYAFHLIYFIVFSSTSFLPKYFGELGMGDSQIGMLMSLPTVVALVFQPLFGALLDRVRLKRTVMIVLLLSLAAISFWLNGVTGFSLMMLGMTAFTALQLPISPAYTTISLEYTRERGIAYGPIRLVGTVGYQVGALVVGILLAGSLSGLFRFIGVIMLLSGLICFLLPPVRGHQHGGAKVSIRVLLKDRHILALFLMVLVGTITSQFYMSFFSKHLGDLGVSNTMTGILLIVSVAMELPFLVFSDRLAKKLSLWNWMMIGFVLNAIRWIGLAVSSSVLTLMLVQLPAVSIMACFEFFPAIYLNRRVPDALKGSAQSTLMLVSFGVAKVIGSLAGGFVSERVGIPAVFGFNGVLLLISAAAFWRPTRRWIREEGGAPCDNA